MNEKSASEPSAPKDEFQDARLTAFNSGHGIQYNAHGEYVAQGHASIYVSGGGPMNFGITQNENLACLQALFLTDPRDDRTKLVHDKGSRVDGTCTWIKENALYKSWISSQSQLLWISGGPGKGKTMLSIFLAEELEKTARLSQTATFLQYFCDGKDEKRNSAVTVMRGLIFQLLECCPKLFDQILPTFRIQQKDLFTASSFESLWRIFENMIRETLLGDIFCILDGVDECDQASLEVLLEKFTTLFSVGGEKFKLNLVSRELPEFVPRILAGFPRIRLDPDADAEVSDDIQRFINVKINELSSSSRIPYPESLCEYVRNVFQTRAQGTFLWIGLAAKTLKEYEVTEVENALKNLPKGLDELYSRLLLQIAEERRKSASRILRWVVLAVRPLRLSELSIAVEVATSSSVGFNAVDVIRDQVMRCGYFLSIKANGYSENEEDAEVHLIHQSAKDYLLRKERYSNPELEIFRVRKEAGNLKIARKCLFHLQSGVLKDTEIFRATDKLSLRDFPRIDNEYLRAFPLLAYAILRWPYHARSLPASEDIFDLSLPFYNEASAIWRIWLKIWWESEKGGDPPKYFSLLHLASYFGILPLAEKLLREYSAINRVKQLSRINKRDSRGNTALIWAAAGNCEAVVRLLLEKGADIDAKDKLGRTALILATLLDDKAMVRLLLEKGADIETKDKSGDTALILATMLGNTAMVQLLLEKGADIEAKHKSGDTALILATILGNTAMVRLLLEKGADIEAKDELGRTALILVTLLDKKAMVRLLLEKGADIEAKDGLRRTALIWAALLDNKAMVRLLLEKGADIEGSE